MNNGTSAPEPEAKKLHLNTSAIHIKEILAATDFSERATLAAKVAARLAKQLRCGLLVLYAVAPQAYIADGELLPVMEEAEVECAREQLHAYAAKIPQLRTTKHEEIVLRQLAVDAVSEIVETRRVDLVVVGSSGRSGLGKLVLGSVAEATVRRVHCPVLVVGPNCANHHGSLKTMVFATDIPVSSLRAAQYAMSIAGESGSALVVMHVLSSDIGERDIPSEKQSARETLRQLVPDDVEFKAHVNFEIMVGDRAEEIVRLAKDKKAGLIIMGVQKNGVLADHAQWATLSKVVRSAHCPILAVQSQIL